MASSEVRSIVLTMIVSASITVAVELWPRRAADERVSASASASAASPSVPSSGSTPAPAPAPAPAGPAAGAEVAAGRTVATPTPTADAGNAAEAEPAEALPVAFHIRNRRDLNLIDGDIRNVASKPLSITLRAVNASTQAVSEIDRKSVV